MKKTAEILLIVIAWTLSVQAQNFNMDVVVNVVNEEGVPVTNADVGVGFVKSRINEEGTRKYGSSDSNGSFKASALTSGSIGVRVTKNGYYESRLRKNFFKNPSEDFVRPYDPSKTPITVVMHKRINPIPMYAKRVETMIPKPGIEYGYDLKKGDWLPPLGKGIVPDLIFKTEGYWIDYRNNDALLTLSFSNPNDGLIQFLDEPQYGSQLRSLNSAPLNGYINGKTWVQKREQGKTSREDVRIRDYKKDANYYFRVRSVVNDAGEITNALYGKIYGDIEYGGASEDGCYIKFRYYLNPTTNDRNVEFDPDQNLFKNLSANEQVREP